VEGVNGGGGGEGGGGTILWRLAHQLPIHIQLEAAGPLDMGAEGEHVPLAVCQVLLGALSFALLNPIIANLRRGVLWDSKHLHPSGSSV